MCSADDIVGCKTQQTPTKYYYKSCKLILFLMSRSFENIQTEFWVGFPAIQSFFFLYLFDSQADS